MSIRRRGVIALLVAGLALASPAAGAQSSALQVPVTVGTAGGDVTILADDLEEVGPERLVVATGNVEILRGSTRLMADRVELNRATGEAVAQGRVVFYDGEDQLTGQRIEYNLRTGTGVVYQADARAAPYYRLAGERMDRLGASVYQVRKGVFTTCEDDPPTWSFRFGSATADLDEYVYGTNASFWIKNVPLIPFFPFFAAAIRRDRQTGFLFPKFGHSSDKGAYVETPFFWAIDDSQDLSLAPLAYSDRGLGLNGEYRYVLSPADRGRLAAFVVQETAVHDATRFIGLVRQDWQLGPRTSLKLDVNAVSGDDVLREYGDLLQQRSAQRVESNVFLTRSGDGWNLVADAFWYQDLTTPRPTELHRLPSIGLAATRQPVPGLPGLLWDFQGSVVRFVRDVGSDGTRLDGNPRLSRPISLGGFATLTPFAGGRLTGYDRTVTGYRTSRGVDGLIEVTDDEARLRRLLEAGADLETRLSRVFAMQGQWGIDSLLHSVEPRLTYTWVAGWGQDRLPVWTPGVDDIPDASRIEYSLTNRIRGKTVVLADSEPVRWELFRLTLGHSYDTRKARVGDAFATVIAQPTERLRLRSDITYDPVRGNVPSATVDIGADARVVAASVGLRYSDPADITFLQGGFTSQVSRFLAVRGNVNWDLHSGTFVESRLGVELRWQCWALTIEWVNRTRRDDEIRFALNLLGVGGPLSTGVGLGNLGPGGQR